MNWGEFSTRFFAFFKCDSRAIEFPKIGYTHNKKREMVSCFEQTEQDQSTQSGLKMLHPQARKFLSATPLKLFRVATPLSDELSRSAWRVEAPAWAVGKMENYLNKDDGKFYFTIRIHDIKAILFPTEILAIVIDVKPAFRVEDSSVPATGKMILNALYRMQKGDHQNSTFIQRIFSDDRQKQSIVDRIGDNEQTALVRGLCGKPVTLGDLVDGIISKSCKTLMGNRFITNSFLKTGWNGEGDAFSHDGLIDLNRLARSESDHYLPDRRDIHNNGVIIRYTFENVVFALSGEGIACWVKPGETQDFLKRQFKERYQTIYLQLFLLALHQRYALVDLASQLDSLPPWLSEEKLLMTLDELEMIEKLEEKVQKLHSVRVNVANFYLRAYFRQPAMLSNHQQFYQDLQQVLGVNDLLEEVQQETKELDYIINDLYSKKIDAMRKREADSQHQQNIKVLSEINMLIREQERSSRNELLLTLVVEFTAVPYYLYNLFVHAFHVPNWIATGTAVIVTSGTMLITFFRFKKSKK